MELDFGERMKRFYAEHPEYDIENMLSDDDEYEYEPPFNYLDYGLDESQIPDFFLPIFENLFFKLELKEQILNEIVIPFITDINFRQNYKGKWIAVKNNEKYYIVNAKSFAEIASTLLRQSIYK